MSEFVSQSNVNPMSQEEYQDYIKVNLNSFLNMARESIKDEQEIVFQVDGESLYRTKINQEPSENKLSVQQFYKIRKALQEPELVDGSVSILKDGQRVFYVKDRKIFQNALFLLTKDPAELSAVLAEQLSKAEQLDAKGKKLAEQVSEVLGIVGRRLDLEDYGSIHFKSVNYIFNLDEYGCLTVADKYGRGILLNTDGLTQIATDTDIEAFELFGQLAQDLNLEVNSPSLNQAKGKDLADKATSILAILGKKDTQDASLRFESNYYLFTQKGEQLSIVSKETREEVLNQNGFTQAVTEKDMTYLQKIEEVAQQLQVNNPSLRLTNSR